VIKPNNSFPIFIVEDLQIAESFYSDNLGFSAVFKNEWYLHLATESGIQLGFMLPNQPTQPELFHAPHKSSGVIFSLEVDDVDFAHSEAQNNSLNIVHTLRDEEWGQRHFCLQDPNGVYLDIVQAIEPTEEYLQGYTND